MHVLDEVPVENTFIRTPVLLVGPAHCKMNCASDLLVEEDVLCESVDVEVHSNAKLSQSLGDRKSTRLNSSHRCISYAVFCLKKKKTKKKYQQYNKKHN